jgi:hypothetical protein
MSFQNYVDHLEEKGLKVAIHDKENYSWGRGKLVVTRDDVFQIAKVFAEPKATGVFLNKEKYDVKVEGDFIFGHRNEEGLIIAQTIRAYVCAVSPPGMPFEEAKKAVQDQAAYLKSKGY